MATEHGRCSVGSLRLMFLCPLPFIVRQLAPLLPLGAGVRRRVRGQGSGSGLQADETAAASHCNY